MSYRDLRNFSEAMRVLGFPQPISMESFREPNFELVESALRWLAARLEPDAQLSGGKETVDQRVALITHATSFFLSRANIKLNGRKLYGADGWAVRELMKIAAMLRTALSTHTHTQTAERPQQLVYDVTTKLNEIKQARLLATEITAQGAFLYDLLTKEPENKWSRESSLSRPLDLSAMESAIREAIRAARERGGAGRDAVGAVNSAILNLQSKIDRRRNDLQRAENRLLHVHKIRPAYQSELSQVESEIETAWEEFVVRYRCVEALKHQLSILEAQQTEAAEEQQAAIMQLIHKYEAEDVLGKLSDSEEGSSSEPLLEPEPRSRPRPATRPRTRLRINTAVPEGDQAEAEGVFGSMSGSLDLREDTHSDSDSPLEDTRGNWSRSRPATRTLGHPPDRSLQDLEVEDSLNSSSESELRMMSGTALAPRPTTGHGRNSVLSDNEF